MHPLTAEVPKALLPVGEKTIIEYLLNHLAAGGITETILVVGHGASRVQALLGTKFRDMRLTYLFNNEYAVTNNIYSLWLALQHTNDDILFFNGDVIMHREIFNSLLQSYLSDAVVIDDRIALPPDAVKARLVNGRIANIGKQVSDGQGWAIGAYRLSAVTAEKYRIIAGELFTADPANKNISFVEPLRHLSVGGTPVGAVSCNGYPWIEIDTPEDYHEAKQRIGEIIGN